MDQEITNRGAGFETPGSVTDANGTAVVMMPELTAAMEGDDGSGKGYDELPFTVTSAGTAGKNEDGATRSLPTVSRKERDSIALTQEKSW